MQRGDRDVAPVAADAKRLSHGRFQNLLVYVPNGTPTSVVLFLSGDGGWDDATDAMARPLMQQGAMVVGIDWVAFKANLEGDGDACVFPDGDLENLSHFVQAYFHSPTYLSPILVGVSSGASFVYAVLAQAPRNTFAAADLQFRPGLDLQKPLCRFNAAAGSSPIKAWQSVAQSAGRRSSVPRRAADLFRKSRRGVGTLPKVGHDLTPSGWMQFTAGYVCGPDPTRLQPAPRTCDLRSSKSPRNPARSPRRR